MLFYKLSGAALLITTGYLLGRFLCSTAEFSVGRLEAYLEILSYFRSQIKNYSLPIHKILLECDEYLLERCGIKKGIKSLDDLIAGCAVLTDDEAGALARFASGLGRGTRAEAVLLCDETMTVLSASLDKRKRGLADKRRLTMTLCICGAALAVLILL